MKKLFLLFAPIASMLTSCSDFNTTTPKDNQGKILNKQRIHGVETTTFDGIDYQILEVDGHEYLSRTQGGICPLVKDTIKN